jgi:hypothetical protein
MFNAKPTFNADRSRDNVFGNVGRSIVQNHNLYLFQSGQSQRADTNHYIYPKKDYGNINDLRHQSIDLASLNRNNPNAFDRYNENVDKMNQHKQKVDDYTNFLKNGK